MQPKKVEIHVSGGVDQIGFVPMELVQPSGRDVLVRHTAIGVNYIDVYHRNGLYGLGGFPHGLGVEAAGVVEAVGEDVEYLMVGDRVVYAKGGVGAYATHRVLHEENLVMLPPEISDIQAAALMLKGLTAHYLLRRTFVVDERVIILVQAAAGGVGLLLCQWANALGAGVIGTVGSAEKAELVLANGCHHAVLYREEDVATRVRELTEGKGCNVVYDGVGKDTFFSSLDSLVPYGLMVSYGQSSGAIPPFDLLELSKRGSLFLTRPTLFDYKKDFKEYVSSAEELFEMVRLGYVKEHIHAVYSLEDVAQAHADLESRKTTGSLILVP
jgi:NADPH2:quinone reductase